MGSLVQSPRDGSRTPRDWTVIRPQGGTRVRLARWHLMVISVGEDLFLLVLTWRWDDWGGQPCYIFSGHPQRGLYTKDCQEAWGGGEEHSPRGVVSDSDKPEGSLVLLRRRWRGARPGPVLPQAGRKAPLRPAARLPLFLARPQPEGSEPPPPFPGGTPDPSTGLLVLGIQSGLTCPKARPQARNLFSFTSARRNQKRADMRGT